MESTGKSESSPSKRWDTRRTTDEAQEGASDINFSFNEAAECQSQPSKDFQETEISDVSRAPTAGEDAYLPHEGVMSKPFLEYPDTEPIWFSRFLSLFNCDSIPRLLFSRAAKFSTVWNLNGEPDVDLYSLGPSYDRFGGFIEDESNQWLGQYTGNVARKQRLADWSDSAHGNLEDNTETSMDIQMHILLMVVSALPEPWSEIAWEIIEETLWEIIESTCLSLLGVIDMGHVRDFLVQNMKRVTILISSNSISNIVAVMTGAIT